MRRHATAVLTFVTRMVGDRHSGEDIFQEVFLTVRRKREQFAPSRSFRSWLFAIAANCCRAHLRRATRRAIARPIVRGAAPEA